MSEQKLACAHCNGTGTCLAVEGKTSCDECRSFAHRGFDNSSASPNFAIVSCAKCEGVGQRDLASERWHQQTMITLSQSAKNPLPHFHIQQQEETKRRADFRRFAITAGAVFGGIALAGASIGLEIAYPDEHILTAVLPVATAIVSGAIGAYVGGERTVERLSGTSQEPSGRSS